MKCVTAAPSGPELADCNRVTDLIKQMVRRAAPALKKSARVTFGADNKQSIASNGAVPKLAALLCRILLAMEYVGTVALRAGCHDK